jgi:cytochrome P450
MKGVFLSPDYYDTLAVLRRDAPVHEYRPGCWTVARHADVREISRDPERFCSRKGVLVQDPIRQGGKVDGSVLHLDPPEHAPWRQLVTRRFTPQAMARFEPRVRELAREVVEAAPRGVEIDFVDHVAANFPVQVIAELLDMRDVEPATFRRWSDATIESPDDEAPRVEQIQELGAFLHAHAAAKAAHPGDDVASLIATGEVDGHGLSSSEQVMYLLTLLIAGNETTRHLISGMVLALYENPDMRAALAGDPSRIPNAIEECLRWVTPIQAFGRTATRDTEVAGQPVSEGDFLVLLYASANRDEAVYGPTAARFDIDRRFDAAQVAFGFGEHHCLGAALARMEGRLLLEELLRVSPDYEITGEPEWVHSTLVRGMTRLAVVL